MTLIRPRAWPWLLFLGVLLFAAPSTAYAPDRIDLQAEEGLGGHTLREHVGKPVDELRDRLARSRISAASSFLTLDDAQRGVADVLQQQSRRIERWTADASPGEKQAFQSRRTGARGVTVTRDGNVRETTGVRVVLKRLASPGRPYFVLTAFPF